MYAASTNMPAAGQITQTVTTSRQIQLGLNLSFDLFRPRCESSDCENERWKPDLVVELRRPLASPRRRPRPCRGQMCRFECRGGPLLVPANRAQREAYCR